jgi:predicted ABC-class ATPase
VILHVDRVQGDPYASPSRIRILAPTGLSRELTRDPERRLAAEDWLLRRFGAQLHGRAQGSGRSGRMEIYHPGPEVTERSALRLHADGTAEARFAVGLPARGRRILGRQAAQLLLDDVPRAAQALRVADPTELDAHVASICRQRALRRALPSRNLVAFIANGSLLPRASGVDQRPLDDAVPFTSPPSLEVEIEGVRGMGISSGVTLLVGGGFHGKSTVLQALQRGHLDHIPGDGRERVVTVPDTVKIRAEDGRKVTAVDISAFLNNLPGGKPTAPFDTDDASGSTSQAASLMEAIESGGRFVLLDEDTSATNLLVRDARMRQLVPKDQEPITPLVERVRELHRTHGLSTLLVIGGVGDYLGVADLVLAMNTYVPTDVTERAHTLADPPPTPPHALTLPPSRVPRAQGLQPEKIRVRDGRAIGYGGGEIDLTSVEQVLDRAHAYTLAHALAFLCHELVDGRRGLSQLLDALDAILDDEGVESLSPYAYPDGGLVRPRRHEIAATLNRLRTLSIKR